MRPLPHLVSAATVVATMFLSLGCERAPNLAVLPPDIDRDSLIVGAPFPDLVLPSLDGTPRAISQFRGEKLILHIFASW